MIDLERVGGIEGWSEKKHGEKGEDTLFETPNGKVFMVLRPKTVEVRCDGKLARMLQEKYETVMESRYFGKGGIEIVPSGQLEQQELEDLVRLSYNLSSAMAEQK